MKNSVLFLLLLSFLFGCKVSDSITVDSISNTEKLKGYQTFQLIAEDYSDKRNERLKLAFRDKLVDYGFEETAENPDFLIQSVLVTRKFIQEFGHSSSIPGPFYSSRNSGNRIPSGGTNGFVVNRGMIGKVIFLIQDTKTNEIAWMGIGTGVISGGGSQINPEDLDIALYELMATLNP
jgi:hypothetical protein